MDANESMASGERGVDDINFLSKYEGEWVPYKLEDLNADTIDIVKTQFDEGHKKLNGLLKDRRGIKHDRECEECCNVNCPYYDNDEEEGE